MTSGPHGIWRRGAALVCCLLAFVMVGVRPALAGISGTLHDFSLNGPYSKTLGPNGSCSACHLPHRGQPEAIWSRALDVAASDEKKYFNQISNPNYAPGLTLLCYDCHDNHAITGAVDDDPPDASFNSTRLPQDVAFDDDMKTTIPRDGVDSDNKPGYYENIPSGTTGFPNTGGSASTYVSGHYVKYNPGVGGISQGDKLPCVDCHDPHRADNQAFIRSNLAGKSLTGMKASTRMAYDLSTRDDDLSRDICIACHGTSEQATYTAVKFNDVNPSYGSATIAIPTTRISAHAASKTTACTSCHLHNGMSVSCSDCHGFPPLRTYAEAGNNYFNKVSYPDVENYLGGAGAHQRHMDALGEAIFNCEICHGPDPGSAPWHNFGAGVFPGSNPGQNVDIMGQSAFWDPSLSRSTARYTGTASTVSPTPAGYEFTARGGGNQRCANFACHGDPPDNLGDLTWTADMVDGDNLASVWENPNAGDLRICKWCHDATPAAINFGSGLTAAPNVMGTGGSRAVAANFGAEVNGHGLSSSTQYDNDAVAEVTPGGGNGAGKECTVCHDATYYDNPAAPPAPTNIPSKTHFDSSYGSAEKRLWSGSSHQVNGQTISATATLAPDELCVACHHNTGADAGTPVSHHGIPPQPPPPGGYVPSEGTAVDPPFTRVCRQCHEVHGANWNGLVGSGGTNGRNLYMVGKWLDTNHNGVADAGEGSRVDSNATNATANITAADNAVVFTNTTGLNSFDENDGAYNPAADTDDICATCHLDKTRGGDHSGTTNFGADMRGQNCMQCHDHDYDNSPLTVDAFMPSGCEGCHNSSPHVGCDGVPGTADDAPNVMGNGILAAGNGGTPKPYDDGAYGYNVNGHGANGTAVNRPTAGLNPNRNCTECHDLSSPSPSKHFDCAPAETVNQRINTRYYFGKPADTRNTNTSHLVAGFLAGANNPQAKQIGFDGATNASNLPTSPNGCYNNTAACHDANGVVNMRHGTKTVAGTYDNIMQFNAAYDTTDDPKQDRGANNVWTPWTIDDLTTLVDASPPGTRHHGVCVSCHDPHGTPTIQKTRLTNKMIIRNWKGASMQSFCGSNCHIQP